MSERIFADRQGAGRALAKPVAQYLSGERVQDRPLVLALPRGGVPVAARIAEAVGAELDLVVARKIGAPGQPEFGVGAIGEDGPPVFDADALNHLRITERDLAGTVEREHTDLGRRIRRYRGDPPAPQAAGRTVLFVDDGPATG